MEENKTPFEASPIRKGCGIILLVVLVSLWIILLSGLDLFATWSLEQTLFQSSFGISDIRWFIHLVGVLLIFIPTLILQLNHKKSKIKVDLSFVDVCFRLRVINCTNENALSHCPKRNRSSPVELNGFVISCDVCVQKTC